MLQDALHAPERLDHVCAVVVQIPKLSIVPLVRPPERVLLQYLGDDESGAVSQDAPDGVCVGHFVNSSSCRGQTSFAKPLTTLSRKEGCLLTLYLVLLEIRPDPPALVVGKGMPVLLEEGVDARNASIPRVLQILQRQAPTRARWKEGGETLIDVCCSGGLFS